MGCAEPERSSSASWLFSILTTALAHQLLWEMLCHRACVCVRDSHIAFSGCICPWHSLSSLLLSCPFFFFPAAPGFHLSASRPSPCGVHSLVFQGSPEALHPTSQASVPQNSSQTPPFGL